MKTLIAEVERAKKADSGEIANRENNVGEMNKSMKMNRTLALLVVVSAAYAASTGSTYGADWDYSYTFGDGLVVSGSFEGTQSGDFVTGISDLSMSYNGTPVTGPIYAATYDGSAWVNGAVVSFDAAQNNFLFINTDYAIGDYSGDYLAFLPASIEGGEPYAAFVSGPLDIVDANNDSTVASNWTLVDPVPDGASTAMLCGMSLLALGWFRRKLA